jgi:hypothetical protein
MDIGLLRPSLLLVMLALLAAVASGCGGSARHGMAAVPPAAQAAPPVTTTPGNGLDPAILPPRRVPRHGTGPADPAAVRVIRRWLTALRAGNLRRAAAYFAIPSVFQNGTPVLHLDSTTEVLAVHNGFPCGAVATRFRGAGAFTLVRFRLTSRRGGDCHGGEGQTTGGAIRVAGGRIREWYRLYDAEEQKPGPAAIDPGNEEA